MLPLHDAVADRGADAVGAGCRTPILVPEDFDGSLVTRSAQRLAASLERQHVHWYKGLGKPVP